jgi:L-lactate dehydrogenase
MKLGIVGAGAVGAAVAMAVCGRGHACQITLVDKNAARAKGVATDLRYGVPVSPLVDIEAGGYDALAGAELVIVTAGINEQAGGATDRSDPLGRLRLLDANVKVFEDVIPRVVAVAPDAPILVVTNPPEPLVEVTRALAGHERVLSTSTFLDTLRFRVHLGERFGVSPASINAQVIGEHGTASVFLWSTASIGGVRVLDKVRERGIPFDEFRRSVEDDVRFANIAIIEGIGASQYGIGIVTARLAEIIVRDERAIVPVGSHQPRYGTTLSMPTVVGSSGAVEVLWPVLSDDEQRALDATAARLTEVVKHYAPASGAASATRATG